MARKLSRQVNYWTSIGTWYDADGNKHTGGYGCRPKGKLVVLAAGPDDAPTGPTFLKAMAKYTALLELSRVDQAGDGNTLRAVLERYLEFVHAKRKAATYRQRRFLLSAVAASKLGKVIVAELKPGDVETFIAEKRKTRHHVHTMAHGQQITQKLSWGDSTERAFLNAVNAALNWAVKSIGLPKNPLKGMEKPKNKSRSQQCLIGNFPEEVDRNHARILAVLPKEYRLFVQVLKDTGARPDEIAAATAADLNTPGEPEKATAIVYPKASCLAYPGQFIHKTATKGKIRTIRLQGEALKIIRQLAAERPTGTLFRPCRPNQTRRKGQPLVANLRLAFKRARKKLGMPSLVPYSYRHQFATTALRAGMPIDILAELMGNSPEVIREHYSHLLTDENYFRAQLARFMGSPPESASAESPAEILPWPGSSAV